MRTIARVSVLALAAAGVALIVWIWTHEGLSPNDPTEGLEGRAETARAPSAGPARAEPGSQRTEVPARVVLDAPAIKTEADTAASKPAYVPSGPTLFADYSESRVTEVDAQGHVTMRIKDVHGAWDAQRLPNGNVLVTEFSTGTVREIAPNGYDVWSFQGLRAPYRAHRLPYGNTLIADTFANRVIEVNPDKTIAWSYRPVTDAAAEPQNLPPPLGEPAKAERERRAPKPAGSRPAIRPVTDAAAEPQKTPPPLGEPAKRSASAGAPKPAGPRPAIKPSSCERLANGNTLISDMMQDRVIEVTPAGDVVWEVKGMLGPYDARRLANGNTLVTLRTLNKVVELEPSGKEVWALKSLNSPSSAVRLDNGYTIVAEKGAVREFDAKGGVVWQATATWAVSVSR